MTANDARSILPQDLPSAHAAILELAEQLRKSQSEIEQLRARIDRLCRRLFGRSSEQADPRQLAIAFEELRREDADMQPPEPVPEPSIPASTRRGHGRRRRLEDLPIVEDVIDLPAEERQCDCGCELVKIGEDVSEQLDYQPGGLFRRRRRMPKYACARCHEGVHRAPTPPEAIEKGAAGAGLLSFVVTSKYADHLPLHRLEGILGRMGAEISRSTMCGWVAAVSDALGPIAQAIRREVLADGYVLSDDTPITVLDPDRGQFRGHIWTYLNPRSPAVAFEFTSSRSGEGPREFLVGFRGALQADAYSGYNAIYADGAVVEVGCWAHARRPIFDALSSDPLRAAALLGLIRRLYEIEREAKTFSDDVRCAHRREHAAPVLAEIDRLAKEYAAVVTPKSPLGEGLTYLGNQWTALGRYVDDGRLAIDNNAAERELRSVAVGRKNWLFAGSPDGGRRAATLYTIVRCCRLVGIDPFPYTQDVLVRVATHPAARVDELIPRRWKELIAPGLASKAR